MTKLRANRRIIAFFTLLLMISLVVVTRAPQQADAKAILQKAYALSSSLDLSADQFAYTRVELFERALQPRLEDPYHKPVEVLENFVEENWVQGGDIGNRRFIRKDRDTGRTLAEIQHSGSKLRIYDALNKLDIIVSTSAGSDGQSSQVGSNSLPEIAKSGDFAVDMSPASSWGTPAWIIRKTINATEESFRISGIPEAESLGASQLEFIWTVDKESGSLIKYEVNALGARGDRIPVRSMEVSKLQIGQVSELPPGWFDLPLSTPPVTTTTNIPSQSLGEPQPLTLQQALGLVNFRVVLPKPDMLSKLRLSTPSVIFANRAQGNANAMNTDEFDIHLAALRGDALELTYTGPQHSALSFIQGPRERLVPGMQNTPPAWAESRPVQLQIAGEVLTGWVATGGNLNNPPKLTIIMFEIQDTFVYVAGQEIDEATLVSLVNSSEVH